MSFKLNECLASLNKQNFTNKKEQAQINFVYDSFGAQNRTYCTSKWFRWHSHCCLMNEKRIKLKHLENFFFPVIEILHIFSVNSHILSPSKHCIFCKHLRHSFKECLVKARQFQINPSQNYSNFRLNFSNQLCQQTQNFYQNGNSTWTISKPSRPNLNPNQYKTTPNLCRQHQQGTHHMDRFVSENDSPHENWYHFNVMEETWQWSITTNFSLVH